MERKSLWYLFEIWYANHNFQKGVPRAKIRCKCHLQELRRGRKLPFPLLINPRANQFKGHFSRDCPTGGGGGGGGKLTSASASAS